MVPIATLAVVFLYLYPPVAPLRYDNPKVTAFMEEQRGPIEQQWVPLEQISPYLKQAVVIAEDDAFYIHNGIDLEAMRKAIREDLKRRTYAHGFSTITMQLAKNLFLSDEKTILRKVRQMILAWRLERELSKERILEIYLNVIEWGRGIYGAEAASQYYFHRPARTLGAFEAAFLAAIVPNPRGWGTWPPGPYVRRRQMSILSRMGGEEPRESPPQMVPGIGVSDITDDPANSH